MWFGNDLHCLLLINSHQIRSHGYSVCDDPWDSHRPLRILTARSYYCLRRDRTSFSNCTFRRTGRWKPSQLSKLRLQFGTQRICTCPDCSPFDKCRQLYTNRFAGYMVGFGGTSTCKITTPRLPQCLLALCWTDPCPRCTYGDELCRKCRNRCSVYEQTAFVRDI
jgi:hypothetical protein